MLTNATQHHDDELEDIETLRRLAMESMKAKDDQQQQNNFPLYHSQPLENSIPTPQPIFASHSFPSSRPRFGGPMRPRFNGPPHNMMNFQGAPYHPQQVMPPFIPNTHINPQFLGQPQIFPNEYAPPIGMDYVPTPAVRLSPRSLEFVESNKKALMNAKKRSRSKSPVLRRRYSRESRSRSRSPVKRRSSRSPYNNRNKRYKSKSPNSRGNYKNRKISSDKDANTNSPNRSQSNRYNNNKRGRDSRYNNGNKFDRRRSESDKEEEIKLSPVKSSQSDKEIEEKKETLESTETKSISPIPEESTTPPLTVVREKTEQELEDELLATDDEAIDIGINENDLDFLDMDDSESENEGRFKDKPSANVVKKQTTSFHNNKNSSYSSKQQFDKSKPYRNRDDRFKRRDYGSRKNSPAYISGHSPDYRRSPERKSTKEDEKQLFKPTFKTVDGSLDKNNDDTKKVEKSSIVRSAVTKADSSSKPNSSSTVKSVITTNDESSKSSEMTRKKKIRDRLGDYIGDKAKSEGTKSWSSSKQVTKSRRNKPHRRQVVLSLNV